MNIEVKIQMLRKKITQVAIAKQLGIDRSTVAGVVNGHRKSRRIQQAIADAVGIPYRKLWGKAA